MKLEEEATGGVKNWGWHWPESLVRRAWAHYHATGEILPPDYFMDIPETWENDIFQMEKLFQFHTIDTARAEEKQASSGSGPLMWTGGYG